MNAGGGSIRLTARRSGDRTILERIHYDGISRCSRSLPHADAALLVLSQMGPGVVRGDRVTMAGHLRARSHVIITSQSATRLMGGPAHAQAHSHWTVDDGAFLEILGEPIVATADAGYTATTEIDLGAGATALVTEIARIPAGAAVTLRTAIRQGGREIAYDAIAAASVAPDTVGTLTIAGLTPERIVVARDILDALCEAPLDRRVGVGVMPHGVLVRVLDDDVWLVRSLLAAMRDAVCSAVSPRV